MTFDPNEFVDDLGNNNNNNSGGNNGPRLDENALLDVLTRAGVINSTEHVNQIVQNGGVLNHLANLDLNAVHNALRLLQSMGSEAQTRRAVGMRELRVGHNGLSEDDVRNGRAQLEQESRRLAIHLNQIQSLLNGNLRNQMSNATNDAQRANIGNAQGVAFGLNGYIDNLTYGGRNEFYDTHVNPHRATLNTIKGGRFGVQKPGANATRAEWDAYKQAISSVEHKQQAQQAREAANRIIEETLADNELRESNPGVYHYRLSAGMSLAREARVLRDDLNISIDPRLKQELAEFASSSREQSISKFRTGKVDVAALKRDNSALEAIIEKVNDRQNQEYTFEGNSEEERDANRQQVIQQAMNLIRTNSAAIEKQTTSLNKTMGGIIAIINSLGITQAATKIAMTDPHNYTFKPAMGMLGNMGPAGSVLSEAMSAQGDYDHELNMKFFQGGIGLAGAGLAGRALGGNAFKGPLGTALTVGSVLAGGAGIALGASGRGDDLFKSISERLGGEGDETVFQKTLGKSMMNPTPLIERYKSTLPTLSMWGLNNIKGSEGSPLGFLINGSAQTGGRGNTVMNDILRSSYNGISLQGLMNPESAALNQAVQSVGRNTGRDGASGLGALSTAALVKSTLYGTSVDNIASQMGTIRGYGGKNILQDLNRTQAVVGNEKNKTFASEVLVPALLKVTSSLTFKNIATNGSEINKMVLGYYKAITSSKGNFANLAKDNPELIGKMIESMSESIKSAKDNPAKMQALMRYGISAWETPRVMDDPDIMAKFSTGAFRDLKMAGATNFDKDGKALDNHTFFAMNQKANEFGMDYDTFSKVMAMEKEKGPNWMKSDDKEVKDLLAKLKTDEEENAKKITADDLTKTANQYAQNAETLTNVMQSFTSEINILQKSLHTFITSKSFEDSARTGINLLIAKIADVLKIDNQGGGPNGGSNATNGGATGATQTPTPTGSRPNRGNEDRASFNSSVNATGTADPAVAVADKVAEVASTPLDALKEFLGLDAGSDVYKRHATNYSNLLTPKKEKELRAAIQKNDKAAAARILSSLYDPKGGITQPGFTAVQRAGGMDLRGNVTQDKALEAAQNVLNLHDSSEAYLEDLGRTNEGATATARGDIRNRTNAYQLRGNTVKTPLRNTYNNNLSNFFYTARGKPEGSQTNTLASKFFKGDKLKEIQNFDDRAFLDKKIKELEKKLAGMKKDSVQYNQTSRTLESLRQIKKNATYDSNGFLPGGQKYNSLEASRFAYMALQMGGGQIDPDGLYKGGKGELRGLENATFGGIGGITQVDSAMIKENYSKGGYTGGGGKHEEAGTVHRGEYVIPSERINGNQRTINSLLAGEKLDSRGGAGSTDSMTSDGETVTLVMEVSGYSPEQLKRMVQQEVFSFAKDARLMYR